MRSDLPEETRRSRGSKERRRGAPPPPAPGGAVDTRVISWPRSQIGSTVTTLWRGPFIGICLQVTHDEPKTWHSLEPQSCAECLWSFRLVHDPGHSNSPTSGGLLTPIGAGRGTEGRALNRTGVGLGSGNPAPGHPAEKQVDRVAGA